MRNYYFAMYDQIGDKYHAYVYKVAESTELLHALNNPLQYFDDKTGDEIPVTKHYATIMPTRQKAIDVVDTWTQTWTADCKEFFGGRYRPTVYRAY